jgi:DNA-binding phage protein
MTMSTDTNDPILQNILNNSRSYDEWLVGHLKAHPDEAHAYLETAKEEYETDGDLPTLLLVMCDLINAQGGIDPLAQRIGMDAQRLTRILTGQETPPLETLLKILSGFGLRMRPDARIGEEPPSTTPNPAQAKAPTPSPPKEGKGKSAQRKIMMSHSG